jgi:GTP diphosphokinase / guanosine-3',5'-bis(diphosphate) 3'-diphosphatase
MTPLRYDFDIALEEILNDVRGYYPKFGKKEEKLICDSFTYGRRFFHGHKRKNGDPYFAHATETAKILLAIKPDIDTIMACFLYNVIRYSAEPIEEIEQKFEKDVRFICECMKEISQMQLLKENHHERQFKNIQKLLIVISRDIRVLFLKLAARIHNLQTLDCLPKAAQESLANEACEIFAPVANQLGLYEFKVAIEDLCFKQLHPQIYKTLQEEIAEIKREQKASWKQAEKEIIETLEAAQIKVVKVMGRQKHFYSVYKKMKRKNFTSCSEVYDLFGLRVLVKSGDDCYRSLGALHARWNPMPHRFKDYISVPKPNGYQSLHTTLLGLANNKFPTEIQIRTPKMDSDAERGPACHWAYKKAGHSSFDENYLRRMQWLPKEAEKGESSRNERFQEMSESILADRIYVFTPRGDVETLPAGSTPVDFAYAVHSNIGDSCVGARVNGVIKPLDYKLQSREIVEILTKKGRQPNPAWLDFVQSVKAKERIRSFVNNKRKEETNEKDSAKTTSSKVREKISIQKSSKRIEQPTRILIGGERNIPFKIPVCCKPKAGQSVIAYKSRGLFFTIHKENCAQLKRLSPDRFLEAHFVTPKKLEIQAIERIGLSRDYMTTIANHGLNVDQLSTRHTIDKQNKNHRISNWNFTIEVRSDVELQKLIKDLQEVPNVLKVKER